MKEKGHRHYKYMVTYSRTCFNKVAEFEATTFEDLFNQTEAIDWSQYMPVNGKMHVVGKSVKSTLHSVPDCQSIVKKAVVKSMHAAYNQDWFTEDGPVYKIEVALLKDVDVINNRYIRKRDYTNVDIVNSLEKLR